VELRGLDHCDYHKIVSTVLSCFTLSLIYSSLIDMYPTCFDQRELL
jgi:hypothetical protein